MLKNKTIFSKYKNIFLDPGVAHAIISPLLVVFLVLRSASLWEWVVILGWWLGAENLVKVFPLPFNFVYLTVHPYLFLKDYTHFSRFFAVLYCEFCGMSLLSMNFQLRDLIWSAFVYWIGQLFLFEGLFTPIVYSISSSGFVLNSDMRRSCVVVSFWLVYVFLAKLWLKGYTFFQVTWEEWRVVFSALVGGPVTCEDFTELF